MLFNLLMSGDFRSIIIGIVLGIPAVIICLTFHELAHGLAAYILGDKTAKASGRLTLDPMKHIDPLGFICMLFLGYGWAKPIPISVAQFKNRKLGLGIVSAAGPLANLILGFFAYVISIFLTLKFYPVSSFSEVLVLFFTYIASLSISLGVFNLFPIYPLDGSKILDSILPLNIQIKYQNFMQKYGPFVLLAVIAFLWVGGLSYIIESTKRTVLSLAFQFLRLFL